MHTTRVASSWPVPWATIVLVLSFGCGSPAGPESHIFPLGGTWTGTGIDFYQPIFSGATPPMRTSHVTVNITQNGASLSGTWSITYADPANNGAGTLTGSASAQEWNCKQFTGSAAGWDCDEYRTLVNLTLTSTTTGFPTLHMKDISITEPDRKRMGIVSYQDSFELDRRATLYGTVTLLKQ